MGSLAQTEPRHPRGRLPAPRAGPQASNTHSAGTKTEEVATGCPSRAPASRCTEGEARDRPGPIGALHCNDSEQAWDSPSPRRGRSASIFRNDQEQEPVEPTPREAHVGSQDAEIEPPVHVDDG